MRRSIEVTIWLFIGIVLSSCSSITNKNLNLKANPNRAYIYPNLAPKLNEIAVITPKLDSTPVRVPVGSNVIPVGKVVEIKKDPAVVRKPTLQDTDTSETVLSKPNLQ